MDYLIFILHQHHWAASIYNDSQPIPCFFTESSPLLCSSRLHTRLILATSRTQWSVAPSLQTMRSAALYYTGCEEHHQQPHFLEACFLCQKRLGHNSDIFMYRGNTPFCSQECRQEQMQIDDAKEKSWKVSKKAAHIQTDQTNKSGSNKTVRSSTIAVAY